MKCGHNSNGQTDKGEPVCVICDCTEVVETPNLQGRTAKCSYFGKRKPNRRYANDECNYGCRGKPVCECGSVPSKIDLPFFEYLPNEKQDKFYCGCFGWD
jgi:hypothetical protein